MAVIQKQHKRTDRRVVSGGGTCTHMRAACKIMRSCTAILNRGRRKVQVYRRSQTVKIMIGVGGAVRQTRASSRQENQVQHVENDKVRGWSGRQSDPIIHNRKRKDTKYRYDISILSTRCTRTIRHVPQWVGQGRGVRGIWGIRDTGEDTSVVTRTS